MDVDPYDEYGHIGQQPDPPEWSWIELAAMVLVGALLIGAIVAAFGF